MPIVSCGAKYATRLPSPDLLCSSPPPLPRCAISGKSISKADGVSTGIWECESGEFDVPNRPNVESVMILKGYVKLTDMDSGEVKELRAGDAATLEKGSSVKWEVIETCRKFYVIA